MKGAVATLLLLLCLPTFAHSAGTSSQDFSFFSSFLQMIAALTIVIGLILLTRYVSNKFIGTNPAARFSSKHIRLVETRYIAPKKSLILIEVGGEYLLLANSENKLTLIKQVDILEDIEVIDNAGTRGGVAGFFRSESGRQKG